MNKDVFHSVLQDCPHCGACDMVCPPIEEQIITIVSEMQYDQIQMAMKGLGYERIPTQEQMMKDLKERLEEVVSRVRKTLNTRNVSGSGQWYVWVDDGVVNARWSVTEWGWMP